MMSYSQFYHKFNNILMIIVGISFPFLLVKFIPVYYYGDIEIFRRWGDCWGENIYSLCKADYPVIGVSLTAGIIHKSVISWNGFNLWMFLPEDMMSSDKITLFYLMGKHKITVYQAGITLYSLFISFISITGLKKVQKLLKQTQNTELHLIALLCFFLGLCYLGFNVLLTGTHERYLHLGYPFILIAVIWFYSQEIGFSWLAIIGCFFCATSYGLFVYSVMSPLPRLLFPFQRHQFLASIHLFLLLFLLAKWIEICQGTRLKRKIDGIMKELLKTYGLLK